MKVRKAISKGVRFEVFKRDRFTCQYCGAHPPQVVLHVDHIKAVANGGTNAIDNLITACLPCNLGKGAKPLTAVPQSLKEKAAEAAEREAQIKGYSQVMQAAAERVDAEAWLIAACLRGEEEVDSFNRAELNSIRAFIKRAGYWVVRDAAEVAASRFPVYGGRTFKYFCGVCWSKIKEAEQSQGGMPR